MVMAWPCGLAVSTDAAGAFRVSCPHGIDSLTFSCVGFETQIPGSAPLEHIDVWMRELEVMLGQAKVSATRFPEWEAQTLARPDLMQALDATPGLQSLDLGPGMVQPVIRGLYGSRVAVLEDGVPQRGGRWGSDHGVLVAPELQVASAWVPGGGHVWMGPEAVGGGLRFESPSRQNSPITTTRYGAALRAGSPMAGVHALHIASSADVHWHAGLSVALFGSNQVPQRRFSYLGRVYDLETAALPNTAGRSGHAVLGVERVTGNGRNVAWSMRASDVTQGLFPGIIGIPLQGDLAPNDGLLEVRLPMQHASRVSTMLRWTGKEHSWNGGWEYKLSGSWNQRREFAPSHAHGWGPLPESDLSLSLEEWTAFSEARLRGAHSSVGAQAEGQWVTTSGWEFLIPSHRRIRMSVMGEAVLAQSTLSARLDVVQSSQQGHEEPSFNAEGSQVGIDVRANAFDTLMPGDMVSWQRPLQLRQAGRTGTVALVAYGRVPSNHEWGANGIHHGSFRFEQGNPNLGTEWALEGRAMVQDRSNAMGWRWNGQGFLAFHKGFISITPSAQFAPISHAGQIYRFLANDAFRVGMEGGVGYHAERHAWTMTGSLLGQWDVATGLGLPFTSPAQARWCWSSTVKEGLEVELACRTIAPALLTARNEASTPGAALADMAITHTSSRGQWALEIQNAFNSAWLDHVSAYRALGLVAQGRWIQLRFTTDIKKQLRTQQQNQP